MQKKLISVCGLIATGKSTFLKKLESLIPEIGVFIQNIDGYENLIELYYGDKKTYSCVFQAYSIYIKYRWS